jgi:hypothetical protein
MKKTNNGLDLTGITLSLISGLIGGAASAFYAFMAVCLNSLSAHILLLILTAVITFFAVVSRFPRRTVFKCGASIIGYLLTILLGIHFRIPWTLFRCLNPEYGEMNAGGGLGFIIIFLPLSVAILIFAILLSGIIATEKLIKKYYKRKNNND